MVNQILLGAFLLKQTDNNKPISRFWGKKPLIYLLLGFYMKYLMMPSFFQTGGGGHSMKPEE